jgi:predicted transcriptional regulator
MSTESSRCFQELVAEVAAAYFSANQARVTDIAEVIRQIAEGLGGAAQAPRAANDHGVAAEAPKATRAQVKSSIRPDCLISFEDHRPYKTLGRHLSARGLTPDAYRAKWGLPDDYPMVAPSYSATRSRLAKQIDLAAIGTRARQAQQGKAALRA